jgi:hypothetical protein
MSNTAFAFPWLLLAGGWLMAQTGAPAPTTAVVYSQPSASDVFIAAHPGATFVKADSNGLTFRNADGHYTFFTAPGIVHQQNGQWLPAQLQVAQVSDGSGWQLQGTAMNVAFTGATGDKDMVVSSGAVTFSFHFPSFSYNGDDTFTFQENGTAWLLRVSQNSVDIEATVATHVGKGTHSFTYNPGSATVTIDQNGSLNVGNAALVSRAVVRGADSKLYGICSPWSASGSVVSFTCDDTALPGAAFPYVIDPSTTTWPFNSSFFTMQASPVEYVGTGSAKYFSWYATANLSQAVGLQPVVITSSTINVGSLGGSTAWDSEWGPPGSAYTRSCNVYGVGTDNSTQAWVTALTYWTSGITAGCILSVTGQSSLSGTVTFWIPSVSAPSTPSGPSSGVPGASYTYSTGGSTATSGDTPQYRFNWGDGSNSGWLAPGTTSASHVWASPGTYQVTATAEDAAYGTTYGSGSKTVTITPPPPTLTSVSPSSGFQNSSVAVTLTGTNFASPATVSTTNSGIAVSGVTVVSSTRITATFTIGASAALGAANVTVTAGGSTSGAVTFTVNQAPMSSVSTFPVGLQVTVDGVACTCNGYCDYYWVPGTQHTIAASTQPGTTGTQWLWASWSDGGAASHSVTASASGANYTASFNPQYYFTSSVSPAGTGTIAPGNGWYNAGASFWATATANTGYQFSTFNLGTAGVATYDVVMNGPVTLTATFVISAISITTGSSLTPGSVGVGYSLQLASSGGFPPDTWSLVAGSGVPPPGVALSSTGLLGGTPTAPAAASFTAKVSDSHSQSATQVFSLTVSPSSTSPVISSITQSGAQATISGANFGTQQSGAVTLNGTAVPSSSIASWSPTQIVIAIGSAGSANVVVIVNGLSSNSEPFTPAPIPITLSLSSGPMGMGFVINGSFDADTQPTVTFGGTPYQNLISWNATAITVQVPSTNVTAGQTYPVVVTLSSGLPSSPANFNVTNGFGCGN